MKISKIENSRAGISMSGGAKEKASARRSTLYRAPAKQGEVCLSAENLRSHVEKCNKKAQNLYRVLSTEIEFCADKDRKKLMEDLAKKFNTAISDAFREIRSEDHQERVHAEVSFIRKNISERKYKVKMLDEQKATCEEMIRELVLRKTRKTLRKEVKLENEDKMQITDIMSRLMMAVCVSGDMGSAGINKQMLRAFFEKIDNDYMKYDQIDQIVKSIKLQSVKENVVKKDGKYLLQPMNADHKKKKYVFEFMQKYAAADEEQKTELRRHIEALIGLYLCGGDGYEKVYKNVEKSFSELKEDNTYVDANVGELLDTLKELYAKAEEKKEEKAKAREAAKAEYKKQKNENRETVKRLDAQIQEILSEIREKEEELKNAVVNAMSIRYRTAAAYLVEQASQTVLGETYEKKQCSSADLYWIDYIDDTVKKLLLDSRNKKNAYRYEVGFLANHIWKEWTQYMATRYIELGKAVYHFAVPELSAIRSGESVSICEVKPEYRNGISGFDYERIKAEESLEREMAQYIAFAVNNFATAAAPEQERQKNGREDVLLAKTESENKNPKDKSHIVLYPDADRRFLQFFGGKSHFQQDEECEINLYSGEELFREIRPELYRIRNIVFHYTTKEDTSGRSDHDLAKALFDKELRDISALFWEKYYTNNVWKFYGIEVIDDIMKIYSGKKERKAQVPAFNKVISRPALPRVMNGFIKGTPLRKIMNDPDKDLVKQYWSALFFVLKELYYYDFLQEQNRPEDQAKERFFRSLKKLSTEETDAHKKKAWESFENRISEIGRDVSFGEICQGLMVEYMLQNNDSPLVRKEKTGKKVQGKDTQIYKHYRTLLYKCIQDAFMEYLKEKWEKLREPDPKLQKKEYSKEEFCQSNKGRLSLYDHLNEIFHSNDLIPSWYVTAHFINPKYLNHLIGSIRNYLQFTEDIEKRAQLVGEYTDDKIAEKNQQYRNLLEVLEFVIHFCGKITDTISDYFEVDEQTGEDKEYARYLSDFLDFQTTKNISDISTAFHMFCEQKVEINGKKEMAGIYYDGEHAILNRNVIRANMYGNVACLRKCMRKDKISIKEIRRMYAHKSELDTVLKEGVCRTEEEQKSLRQFQNEKNRIELLDLVTYAEILNDMYAQLIGWIYMRERDLMYYQLGYHYTKLFWTDTIGVDDARRKLLGEEVKIEDGAILYQILAVNSYNLPVISNKNGQVSMIGANDRGSIGGSAIGALCKNYQNGEELYLEGLELFENKKEHDNVIEVRNEIDHFKYFAKANKSMLKLYSEVYDRFFRHDHKLKKSVPTVFCNILARNFVDVRINMELGSKCVGKGKDKEKEIHKAVSIKIADNGMESTALTYTIKPDPKDNKKEMKILVDAHSEIFITQLQRILEYPE